MKKPVTVYAKNGLVTLKIGRWPFRYKVQWNVHQGEDVRNLGAFITGLMNARTRASRSKPLIKK